MMPEPEKPLCKYTGADNVSDDLMTASKGLGLVEQGAEKDAYGYSEDTHHRRNGLAYPVPPHTAGEEAEENDTGW